MAPNVAGAVVDALPPYKVVVASLVGACDTRGVNTSITVATDGASSTAFAATVSAATLSLSLSLLSLSLLSSLSLLFVLVRDRMRLGSLFASLDDDDDDDVVVVVVVVDVVIVVASASIVVDDARFRLRCCAAGTTNSPTALVDAVVVVVVVEVAVVVVVVVVVVCGGGARNARLTSVSRNAVVVDVVDLDAVALVAAGQSEVAGCAVGVSSDIELFITRCMSSTVRGVNTKSCTSRRRALGSASKLAVATDVGAPVVAVVVVVVVVVAVVNEEAVSSSANNCSY